MAIANPTELLRVNIAKGVTNLLYIGLGIFLVILFFRGRQREDSGHTLQPLEPNSPEDIERLSKRRNWILGFVSLVVLIGSVGSWLLIDFTAGFTLINAVMLFDILTNLAFCYIIFELFTSRKDMMPLLFTRRSSMHLAS